MKKLPSASLLLVVVAACARQKSEPQSPASVGASAPAGDAAPAAGGAGGYPQQQYGGQPGQPAPPPPSPTTAEAPKAEPATPSTSPQSRSMALSKASNDIEAAQRELDVAGSSCQNACRALGSMDRAAGHLCQLTREDNTHDRCDDAKRRLFNARDKVRGSCGTCPDNQPATDRNAPVPSMR